MLFINFNKTKLRIELDPAYLFVNNNNNNKTFFQI